MRAWESPGEHRRQQYLFRVPLKSDSTKKEVNMWENLGFDISHNSLRRAQEPEMLIWVFIIIFIIIIISHTSEGKNGGEILVKFF